MKMTPGSVQGDHILLTGPIQGVVQLADGRTIDVSPAFIEVDDDDAEEICHRIGVRHMLEGHPNLMEHDPETGEVVQRPFLHVPTKRFAKDLEGKEALGSHGAQERTLHPEHAKGIAPFGVKPKES